MKSLPKSTDNSEDKYFNLNQNIARTVIIVNRPLYFSTVIKCKCMYLK